MSKLYTREELVELVTEACVEAERDVGRNPECQDGFADIAIYFLQHKLDRADMIEALEQSNQRRAEHSTWSGA
jgi:hypothetical protein